MAFSLRSQFKMSEETFDFKCTACAEDNKTAEAVKYCVECSGYCCQPCVDKHKNYPPLRKHNLLEVSQANLASGQQAGLPEFPTERCSIHKGKVMDMYCEVHNTVGCYVCIAKNHKSCPDSQIHSIPDMIDILFKLSDCKQTSSLLKDMMVSMETESKSKTSQLQKMPKSKKEELDKVNTFEKALQAILTKKAESSRQEIESVYKQLETEIVIKQQAAGNIHDDLKKTDDKLNDSDGNRAQQFVCTKIGQEKIKEADAMKISSVLPDHTDVIFIPDRSIMKYMRGLQGIGQVQKDEIQTKQKHGQQTDTVYKNQKDDLYKIKGHRDINIKLSDESGNCRCFGCCLTPDNQLLVTDCSNTKLKRIDLQKMSVVAYCTLDSAPYGGCSISRHEVAVACYDGKKIEFVSIQGKMSPTRQIKMSHRCYDIAFNDDNLYVTDNSDSLYMYDMTGTLLKTITQDKAGNKLFRGSRHVTFNVSGNRMYVGGWERGVVCFDKVGTYVSTVADTDLNCTDGVCVDDMGNMFVVGCGSHNVVQFSENGRKVGVVVNAGNGLQRPRSVCFQGLNKMFVTMNDSNIVKMYDLE